MNDFLEILKNIMENNFFHAFVAALIFIVIIKIANVFIASFIERIIKRTKESENKKQLATFKTVAISIVDAVLIILGIFHVLEALGVDIRPLLATAGVAGVAIGFGAKTVVEDIIIGILILVSGQIRVGDDIAIDGSEGTVEEVNLRMVILRDASGAVHYIRNSLIAKVINKSRKFSYAVFNITLSHKEDTARITKILQDLGEELKQNKDFKTKILDPIEVLGMDKFDAGSITIICRIKTTPSYLAKVHRTFTLMLKNKFDELGIQMPLGQVVLCKTTD